MSSIKSIRAREILSSGSAPSIEVECILESGASGKASVPFGVSAGSHEASVILDGDKERFRGKGMLKAAGIVNNTISKLLIGEDAFSQRKIDGKMIKADGTENKQKLGGNSILGASLAVARASANERKRPLYMHIRDALDVNLKGFHLPGPMMVVVEGGKHADNSTDLQEYLISIKGKDKAREKVRKGIEIYLAVKDVLKSRRYNTNVGNEGAFAPSGMPDNEEPLKIITEAIKKSGMKDVGISHDAAASEIFSGGKYILSKEKKELSSSEMIRYFENWAKKYNLITLEDPLAEDDWESWTEITKKLGSKIKIIGDDLTVTNINRLEKAIKLKAINTILIKLNQIGTLTETVDCCMLARKNKMDTIVSHRGGGETNDTFMVDLAVAVNSSFIKVGPSRGERVEKYNRLMEIGEELRL